MTTRCAHCGTPIDATRSRWVLERGGGNRRPRDITACSLPCLAHLADQEGDR